MHYSRYNSLNNSNTPSKKSAPKKGLASRLASRLAPRRAPVYRPLNNINSGNNKRNAIWNQMNQASKRKAIWNQMNNFSKFIEEHNIHLNSQENLSLFLTPQWRDLLSAQKVWKSDLNNPKYRNVIYRTLVHEMNNKELDEMKDFWFGAQVLESANWAQALESAKRKLKKKRPTHNNSYINTF